jgi:hypothetical protein
MSSGFKKQLLQSQAYSGTTKKGDVIKLPPYSEDVILVTKCSGKDSGVVKASLEHSPDTEDANFSIVQSEKVSISAATTGWGNLKYIDTTATGTGSDYKNKTVRANNLSGQSNDIFHSKMTKDDPWTISTWIKSSSQPATTNTANFDVTKYVYTKIKDTYNAANKNRAIYVQNPWTYSDWASSTNWSISMWLKYEGDDASGIFGMIQHGIRGIEISKNSTSLSITHGLPSTDPKVTIPATLNDGNWHNVTITHSNSDTYETIGTDPSTCNTLVYLNGALVTPSSGGTATATVTYGNDSSNPVYLNLGSDKNGDVGASSTFLHVSTWTKTLSSTEVNSILGANDKPKDLTGQTGLACWLPLGDGYDTSNPSTVDTVVGSSAKFWDMSGNGRHALPHQADTAGGGVTPSNSDVGWDQTDSPVEGVTNLGTSENVYIAPSTTSTDTYLPVLFSTGSSAIVPAVPSNTKYTELTGTTTNYKIEMGDQSDFNDSGDNFWFDRTKKFTISWWMNVPSITTTTTHDIVFSPGHAYDTSPGVGAFKGFQASFRQSKFWLWFLSSGSSYGYIDYTTTQLGISTDSWHHYTITYDGPAMVAAGSSTTNLASNLKLYVDGSLKTGTAGVASTWLDDTTTDTSSTGEFRLGYPANGFHQGQVGKYDEVAIWKKVLTATQIQDDLYNSGNFKDLSTIESSDLKRYYRFESSDGTDSAGKHTGTVGSSVTFGDLSSGDSFYSAGAAAYDVFGNGMRMSFTKKLKTDATWDASGAQTSRFLLSFDGFEDTAAYFLGYNTTFTRPLHPKTGAEDASADLLDGEWHNIIVSYRGGAPGTAVNPHDYIAVCFDGKQMTTTDCVEKTSTVTFINDHFRYTDVSEDLRGTFFLSAGDPFVQANTNSKYAFQGGFDETSLHDDSWQLSSSPSTGWTSGGFNTMKPNTIYGIDSTRNSANDAGSPYDLKNPSSIGHPGPTGNSYLEPSASAVGGGLQAYYRWGDTTGDCSTSIHDVQSAIDNVTDRDLAVLYGSISAGDATDENSAAWDTAVDTVAEGGIEVASTSIPGSAGFALENVQITCADGLQFFRVNAPKLSNLRIKWTGAGTATSVEASIHYRRRKK